MKGKGESMEVKCLTWGLAGSMRAMVVVEEAVVAIVLVFLFVF